MRKIPKTMFTQHPDNASTVKWLGESFINARNEVKECHISFSELKCDEFMWDWEGKYVDEAVIERLFEDNFDYFKKNPLGKKLFLTYRFPNIWIEKGSYRILRGFANIITAYDVAKAVGVYCPPVFEVILPMVTEAEQLIYLQTKFAELAHLVSKDEKAKIGSGNPAIIEIIPLVEDIPQLLEIDKLLERYIYLYQKHGLNKIKNLKYIRPFIARSDPALNYGLVPAVLAAKIAIAKIYQVAQKTGVKMYPIIGCGGVSFRGHLSPDNIKNFLKEYNGIKTVTVQSSFRYDNPYDKVKKAVSQLNRELALPAKLPILKKREEESLKKIINIFKSYYRKDIAKMAPLITDVSKFVPRRRERRLHTGLFGYPRHFKKGIQMPRAITFTCSLYSLGIPPEVIGAGRALKRIQQEGLEEVLNKFYLNFAFDLKEACRYVKRENIKRLKSKYPNLKNIEEDLKLIEKLLKIPVGPQTSRDCIHKNHTSNILLLLEEKNAVECPKDNWDITITNLIEEAGVLRKFLG